MQPIGQTNQATQGQRELNQDHGLVDQTTQQRTTQISKRLREETADPTWGNQPQKKKRHIKPTANQNLKDLDEQIEETAAPIKKIKKAVSEDASLRRKRTLWTTKMLKLVQEKIAVSERKAADALSFEKEMHEHLQKLLPLMLKMGRTQGIGSALTDGPYAGANFLWFAAVIGEWKFVFKILELFPDVDVNATPRDPFFNGQTAFYIAVDSGSHHTFSLIDNQPHIDWSLCPEKKQSPLWKLADKNHWKIVRQALTVNPTLNLNEAPQEGPDAGQTIFLKACLMGAWDEVQFMLDLNQPIDLSATAQQSPLAGRTAFWLACSASIFDIAKQLLLRDTAFDCDTAATGFCDNGITPLWLAAYNQQFDLARMILERKPSANLNATVLQGQFIGATPLNFCLGNQDRGFAKLLIILGANKFRPDIAIPRGQEETQISATEVIQDLMKGLHATRVKIFELLYNTWNSSEIKGLEKIRSAEPTAGQEILTNPIRRKLALQILLDDHPDIIPIKGLEEHMDFFVSLNRERDQQAIANIASLGYREYRWGNGIIEQKNPKAIRDIKSMVVTCLKKQQLKSGVEYKEPLRRKIVECIGKEQEGEPRLSKAFVKEAIQNAINSQSNTNKS